MTRVVAGAAGAAAGLTAGASAGLSAGAAVAARSAVLVAAAVALARLDLPWRPSTLCTLRALTGVPCPFCGSTTAVAALGSGQLLAALRASPLAVLGAPLLALLPLLRAGWRPRLARLSRAARAGLLVAGLAAAELWQLQRYGWLG